MNYFLNLIRLFKTRFLIEKKIRLDGAGERVDLIFNNNIDISRLNIYEKSHYFRYKFAQSYIKKDSVCGDFACGTGYGSIIIANRAKKVIGVDNNRIVIDEIKKRYQKNKNVEFINTNLLKLRYKSFFDFIISFETLEHFNEVNIIRLLKIYHTALKPGGELLLSTPYLQKNNIAAKKLGFHLTFLIEENKIDEWLNKTSFDANFYAYQNYQSHLILEHLKTKDFIICIAKKV